MENGKSAKLIPKRKKEKVEKTKIQNHHNFHKHLVANLMQAKYATNHTINLGIQINYNC